MTSYKYSTSWFLTEIHDPDGNQIDFGEIVELTYQNNIEENYNPYESEAEEIIPGKLLVRISKRHLEPVLVEEMDQFQIACANVVESALLEDLAVYNATRNRYVKSRPARPKTDNSTRDLTSATMNSKLNKHHKRCW